MNPTLASFLESAAPTLASAVLGPFAGVAIAGLGKILGISEATQQDIAKVVQNGKLTPEQLAQIQLLDAEFREHEAQRGVTYAELAFKDRESARQREVATKDNVNRNLAYLIVLAFLSMVGFTLFGQTKVESVLAGTLIGYLSAKAEQVLAYYFGSSRGSDKKSELLAAAMPSALEQK